MRINFYTNYLEMIKKSVGSTMFQNFWIESDAGDRKDILGNGNLSCAYYVSNLLKIFNLVQEGHANVPTTVTDLLSFGRKQIEVSTQPQNIPLGSILVREAGFGETGAHQHIGFYIGEEQAISNNSRSPEDGPLYQVNQHHYTYNNQRKIENILTFQRTDINSERQQYYRLPLAPLQQSVEGLLAQGASEETAKNRTDRSCGIVCVHMILKQLTNYEGGIEKLLQYADAGTEDFWYYKTGIGRGHYGLAAIAQEHGLRSGVKKHNPEEALQIFQQNYTNKIYTICSVTKEFDVSKPSGGHLVVVIGLKYEREWFVICCDPLRKGYQHIKLSTFIQCWTGGTIEKNAIEIQ